MIGAHLVWLGLAVLEICAVRALFPHLRRSARDSGSALPALELLSQRYARGEIDAEQYASMKDDIMDTDRTRGHEDGSDPERYPTRPVAEEHARVHHEH